jgi:hypothetical protein
MTPSSWEGLKDGNGVKTLQSSLGLDVSKESRDNSPTPAVADHQSRALSKSKSQPRVASNLKSTDFHSFYWSFTQYFH